MCPTPLRWLGPRHVRPDAGRSCDTRRLLRRSRRPRPRSGAPPHRRRAPPQCQTAAPSPITNATRPRSNGRDAVAGSSFRWDRPDERERSEGGGASGASDPPARAACTVPSRIAWNAWPMRRCRSAGVRVADRRAGQAEVEGHVCWPRPTRIPRAPGRRHAAHSRSTNPACCLLAEATAAASARADPDPGPRTIPHVVEPGIDVRHARRGDR